MAHRRSAQSAPSYISEREADESELAKLERQFRILDRDGKAYNRQAREQIHKQQQDIEKLQKEQEELHQSLGICKNFSRLHNDSEDTKALCALLEEEDMIHAALIKEKEHQQQLDKEITDMQKKIANLRKEKARNNDSQMSKKGQTERAIRTLEYKLDRALTHFSEQMAKNSQLRKELRTLHVEQIRFQQLRTRLEKELHELRKKISRAVNGSIAAYDNRAEAQSKMILLKEKAVKDLTQYNAELKDLERLIAHECNLKEFMTTKCNGRSVGDQGPRMKEQRIDSEDSRDGLEEVFSKIQAVTGEDNLDLLVTRFIQVEDQKFALFNFVNDQNNEVDVLKEQLSQIRAEIQYFQDNSLQNEKDHGSFLADIEEKQATLQSEAEEYEKQAAKLENILGNVKAVITSILSEMEWDCSTKEDMLDSSLGLTENIIMSYLGLTEDKTTELLCIQAFLKSKDTDRNNPKDLAKFLLSQNSDQLQQQISFQPAVNTADYEADEAPLTDEEEWPISQEELRKKISKQVGEIRIECEFSTMKSTQSARMFYSALKAAETCQDLEKLESLYYIMVRERKVCNRVAQEQLNKQQYCIKKLLKEQEELKIDLNILNAAVKAQQEDENKKKLQALAVIVMDKTLKKEKDCQEQLDKEIVTMTAETIKFKKQKSVVTQCVERDRAQYNLQFMEKKLLRTMNYLDAQMNKIRELKKELKNQHAENTRLLLRRTTFPHKNVTNDLGLYIKYNMNCTTLTCENRVNADNKIRIMKKKEREAHAKNQRTISELAALFPEEMVPIKVKAEKVQKPANAEEVTKEEEDVSVEDAEEFEEPGEITLNTLVTQFIQEENDMCELYTLINEQKLELTIISENSRQLQDEIHHLSKKGNAPEKSGFNFLSTLKKKFEKLQSEIDEYEEQEEMIGKSLEDIKAVMSEILPKLGCECPDIEDDSVENIIMSYLKAMEEKAIRLLNIQAFTKAEVNRLLQDESK